MKHLFSIVLVCLTFVAFSATVMMADVMDGLVAYWPLNEGSGKVAHDVVGGHNGTLDNGPKWVAGADAKMGTGAQRCLGAYY